MWLNWIVKAIRYYQKNISSNLGNRCVFDPSCSHYSEVAYREKGFFKGTFLTVNRLCRCRPQNGGIDEL
ncbi:MAG: membrane protein insertion efficiency factor YidD [Bacteroidia bacterium]|nr:membrane protein insertion efficiency factor YidD [Bacteroidia bacterium]